MAEHEVMWIGRRPAALAGAADNPAASEAFAAAITDACRACGIEVEEYIAAAGAFGSWLVHFQRDGRRHRLVWNGKQQRLALECHEHAGEWRELGAGTPPATDADGFCTAITTLLGP